MKTPHQELMLIASRLASTNPLLGYALEAHIVASQRSLVSNALRFAAKPDVGKFKDQIKDMVEKMKSLKSDLEISLNEDDKAFLDFFDKPIKGQKEVEKALKETSKLLKTANFLARPGAAYKTARVSSFVGFYRSAKEDGPEDFFAGADDVLKQLEELGKKPSKELVDGIIAQLEAFIQEGEDLLNKSADTDSSSVNPEGKPITIEGDEPANPDGIDVDFEDDSHTPQAIDATPEREGYELERIVTHYVDVLQKALKEQDHAAINKFLKELFAETQANVEEDKVAVAAKRLARARILPILVRFAHSRPNVRPLILPYIRVAATRKVSQ